VSLKEVKKGQKQARKETKKDTSASDVAELCAAFEGVRLDDKAGPEQRLTKRQQKRQLKESKAPSRAGASAPAAASSKVSPADRNEILMDLQLSDDVVDRAMDVIRAQFPELGCLYASGAVMFLEPLAFPQAPRFIQIVNRDTAMSVGDMRAYSSTGGSHWLTISNVFASRPNEVVVYDSLFDDASPSTKALLRQLYFLHGDAEVRFERVQQQKNGTSCGRFAIAFAFDLALGSNPRGAAYDVGRMGGHLLAALEGSQVTPFPRRH